MVKLADSLKNDKNRGRGVIFQKIDSRNNKVIPIRGTMKNRRWLNKIYRIKEES